MFQRLPVTENIVSTERRRIIRPFLGLEGEKVPIKMVKTQGKMLNCQAQYY